MSIDLHHSERRLSHPSHEQTIQELKETKACLQAICADCERYDIYSDKKWWGCSKCEYWKALLDVLQKIKEW
jgi:hypothetical protein